MERRLADSENPQDPTSVNARAVPVSAKLAMPIENGSVVTARANALANNYVWNDKISKYGFWALTIGVLLFALPTLIIGLKQAQIASEMGYYYARTRDALEGLKGWMWFRILPDSLMILGGAIIFFDLVVKTFFSKKNKGIEIQKE